ncbi:MAG: glutathione S-transferase family protein [Myxococcota bacterium]
MSTPSAPRITVFAPELTPYTIKVTRALRWKGLPYALEEPGSADDYRRWSPENGLLPVIDVDGTRVQDSAAILDVIDERFPEPPLLSSDAKVAREQRRLEAWTAETFFFHMFRWVRARLGPSAPERDGRGLGPMMRLGLIGPNGQVRSEVFDARGGEAGPAFDEALDELVKLLGSRPFFFADTLSRADLAVYGSLRGLRSDRYPGSTALIRARPALWSHCDRVEEATGGA